MSHSTVITAHERQCITSSIHSPSNTLCDLLPYQNQSIKWLRSCEQGTTPWRVAAYVVKVFVAVILGLSLIGIPLLLQLHRLYIIQQAQADVCQGSSNEKTKQIEENKLDNSSSTPDHKASALKELIDRQQNRLVQYRGLHQLCDDTGLSVDEIVGFVKEQMTQLAEEHHTSESEVVEFIKAQHMAEDKLDQQLQTKAPKRRLPIPRFNPPGCTLRGPLLDAEDNSTEHAGTVRIITNANDPSLTSINL